MFYSIYRSKRQFTLIELVMVIVTLGMLAMIVLPNTSTYKGSATKTALVADIKTLQTAVDVYALENDGSYPVSNETELGVPQSLELSKMKSDFIRNLPKTKDMNYWIDLDGTVWASTVGLTQNVQEENGILSWDEDPDAKGYTVYTAIDEEDVFGSILNSNMKVHAQLKGSDKTSLSIQGSPSDQLFFVSSIDKYSLPTPPVHKYAKNKGSYDPPVVETEVPSEPEVPPVTEPTIPTVGNSLPIAQISMTSAPTLTPTTSLNLSYANSTDPDGDAIVAAEWRIDSMNSPVPPDRLASGTHLIELRVRDEIGDWSEWTNVTVIIEEEVGTIDESFTTDGVYNVIHGGIYAIEVYGAQGGDGGVGFVTGTLGEKGDIVKGEVYLTEGTQLTLTIGKKGKPGNSVGIGPQAVGGGGGGGGSTAVTVGSAVFLQAKGGNGGNGGDASSGGLNKTATGGLGGLGHVSGLKGFSSTTNGMSGSLIGYGGLGGLGGGANSSEVLYSFQTISQGNIENGMIRITRIPN